MHAKGIAGLVSVILVAGCGGTASHAPSTPSAAPAVPQSVPSSPSCGSQFITWRDGGGTADMHALSHALGRAAKAGRAVLTDRFSPASLSRLATAAAGVQQAAQTAQGDPAPACVPGLATDESAATTDYAQEAQGQLDEVQALQNKQIPTALADIRAAGRSASAGLRALRATIADINNFSAANS